MSTFAAGVTKHPKMTRAHFTYLAGMMAEVKPDPTWLAEHDQWAHTVRSMAVALSWTNPNFNRAKFEEACGL